MDQPTFDHLKAFPILEFFEYRHLPPKLQAISAPFCELAHESAKEHGQGSHPQELAAGLRKLLEAKDCIVRASIRK